MGEWDKKYPQKQEPTSQVLYVLSDFEMFLFRVFEPKMTVEWELANRSLCFAQAAKRCFSTYPEHVKKRYGPGVFLKSQIDPKEVSL